MSRLVRNLNRNSLSRILSSCSNAKVISVPHRFSSETGVQNPDPASTPAKDVKEEEIFSDLIDKPPELTEEDILAKRNKSGLREQHRRMVNGEIPYPTPAFFSHKTVKYQSMMYAKFGEKSGIPPGLQWPDYEDIQLRKEYESVAQPFTFQEMVDNVKEKRRLEKEQYEKRAAEVEANMKMVEKLKQEIIAKKMAKDRETQLAQEKREALVEEVRRHFGYKVDPREEKFQELLEKKEKEQRKIARDLRKKDKEAKQLALLLGTDKEKKKKPGQSQKEKEEQQAKKKAEATEED